MMNPHIQVPARFADRRHAGAVLAEHLDVYAKRTDLVVLALPRGGVPVGYEVARHLHAPLDVLVVQKLGAPDQPECTIGAIAGGGITAFDDAAIAAHHVTARVLYGLVKRERAELLRRECVYRMNRPPVNVRGQVVILVDDGVATGATMRAAVAALRRQSAAGIVVAVPVGSRPVCDALSEVADQVICPLTPDPFSAIELWYADFSETSEEEVRQYLSQPTADTAERSA